MRSLLVIIIQQALVVILQTLDLQEILSFEDIFKTVGIVFICTLLLLPSKGNNKANVSGVNYYFLMPYFLLPRLTGHLLSF